MARIKRVGVLLNVMDPPEAPPSDELVNLGAHVFADLEHGARIVAPMPNITVGISPSRLRESEGDFEEHVQVSLQFGGVPSEHKQGSWGPLLEVLKGAGIGSDPETLMALPFVVEPDSETRGWFGLD